jgi:integrase
VEAPRLAKLHRVPFTKADCVRLLEAALLGPDPLMERCLLLIGLDTGARVGELVAADVEDVDLEAGSILFRKTKNQRLRRVFFGVASRPDGGPCMVAMRQWLAVRPRRLLQPGVHALFIARDGAPLTTDRARRIYRALGESAAVERAHLHRGRHTAATEFLAELPGAELHLRNRLGHLSHDVLSDYVTISDSMAREVAESASLSTKWGL